MAYEYKVRRVDGSGTGEIEQTIDRFARDGWRLVSTDTVKMEALTVWTYLYFEREKSGPENPERDR